MILFSRSQSPSRFEKIDIGEDEHRTQTDKNEKTERHADVRYAQKAVAKTVDHIEDGIPHRNGLPNRWQSADRIEHSAQVRERGQDECRDDGHTVEILGIDAVQESRQSEEQ